MQQSKVYEIVFKVRVYLAFLLHDIFRKRIAVALTMLPFPGCYKLEVSAYSTLRRPGHL